MNKLWPDPVWSSKARRFVGGTAGALKRMADDGGYYPHLSKFADFLVQDGALERFEQQQVLHQRLKRVK